MALIWKCEECDWWAEGTAPGAGKMLTHTRQAQGHHVRLIDSESGEVFLDKEGNPIRTVSKGQSLGLMEGKSGRKLKGQPKTLPQGTKQVEQAPSVIAVTPARPGGEVPPGDDKTKLPIVSPLAVSIYRMVPLQATVYNTPGKWACYACAVVEGYPGGFDEFVEVTMLDFWLGRGINPFERLSILFEGVPSELREKLEKAGGVYVPERPGLVKETTAEKG